MFGLVSVKFVGVVKYTDLLPLFFVCVSLFMSVNKLLNTSHNYFNLFEMKKEVFCCIVIDYIAIQYAICYSDISNKTQSRLVMPDLAVMSVIHVTVPFFL